MRTTRELQVIGGSDKASTVHCMLHEENGPPQEPAETPLPATLTFVLLLGVTFAVLWFGVFMLLKERW